MSQTGIVVSVIYSDLHLMQLQVRASNHGFAAEVDTYVSHEEFSDVENQLKGFPDDSDDFREIGIGSKISLRLSTVDDLGHSIISIDMAGDVPEQNGQVPRARFSILVDPAQIDQFASELSRLTPEIGSMASLLGK
jgi:hypothetical protein